MSGVTRLIPTVISTGNWYLLTGVLWLVDSSTAKMRDRGGSGVNETVGVMTRVARWDTGHCAGKTIARRALLPCKTLV